jgi:hypothetical protein
LKTNKFSIAKAIKFQYFSFSAEMVKLTDAYFKTARSFENMRKRLNCLFDTNKLKGKE